MVRLPHSLFFFIFLSCPTPFSTILFTLYVPPFPSLTDLLHHITFTLFLSSFKALSFFAPSSSHTHVSSPFSNCLSFLHISSSLPSSLPSYPLYSASSLTFLIPQLHSFRCLRSFLFILLIPFSSFHSPLPCPHHHLSSLSSSFLQAFQLLITLISFISFFRH